MKKGSAKFYRITGEWLLLIALAVGSGVMLALALPPRSIHWLSWIVFVPLFAAAGRTGKMQAFLLGLLTALAAAWVIGRPYNTPDQFGNLLGAFGMLGLIIGIVSLGFSLFYHRFSLLATAGASACLGVAGEYLSQWLFPVNAAIIHSSNVPMLQMTSITGVWGLSFIVWLTSAGMAAALLRPRSAHMLAFIAVIVVVIYGWGIDRAVNLAPTRRVTLSAVQAVSLFDLAQLSEEAADQGAQMIVWPELALSGLDQGVKDVSKRLRVVLIAGTPERTAGKKPYNSAAVIDRGWYLGSARKTHLFGVETKYYSRSKDQRVFVPRNLPTMGVAICYDTNFTDVTRTLAARGARIIMVPNSDPKTPSGVLHYLHAALMPIRAAENSVVIVRADSSGLSQIIHPSGWAASSLPLNQQGQITREVVVGSGSTLYSRTGDWFAWFSIALTAVTLRSIYKGRKNLT